MVGALGCSGPSLDLPGQTSAWSLELPTGASPDTVPAVFRARVRAAPRAGEPWLLQGELSDYYERAVRRAELSDTLRERAVPLRYWREGDDCWLQPLQFLDPNEAYSLAFEGIGTLRLLHVDAAPAASLQRLFPPPGRPKHRVAVLCGSGKPVISDALALAPDEVPLETAAGMAGLPLPDCWTLSAAREISDTAVSPPELVSLLADAAPWLPVRSDPAPECERGVLSHGACVEAWDDRVFVTPLGEDQLWLLQGQAPVSARASSRTRLLRGLAPEMEVSLNGSVLSSGQGLTALTLPLVTARERPHLVLNEVLANPLGAETTSEWVELLNDSQVSANLGGLWLEDSGGHAPLPDVVLDAGELALLVGPGFRASGQDVPVPKNVRLLSLPSLGTRGLANGGEALALVGTDGIVSRFPLLAADHAGRSWARREPDSADDDAAAFAEHGGAGASPGAANSFDP